MNGWRARLAARLASRPATCAAAHPAARVAAWFVAGFAVLAAGCVGLPVTGDTASPSGRPAAPATAPAPSAAPSSASAPAPASASASAPPRPAAAGAPLPEGASVRTRQPAVSATRQMVVTGHPLASEAGLAMLRKGGTALDAAIAAQMVLTLVEPQSSGIGGGALLLWWDGHSLEAWDGRETAPAAADERLLLGPDGRPLPFLAAAVGGRAVGVPGAVRMLQTVHRRAGRLPWAQLLQPAIALAQDGFVVSERLHRQLNADAALRQDDVARRYFYDAQGKPWPVGHRLRNPALAQILRRLARDGADALHQGPLAEDLVARVHGHATNPGRMSLADLAAYEPRQREPMCTPWRTAYRVCGFPPPSSGHLALMQMLGILERLPAGVADPGAPRAGLPDADWLHASTEAARLAYADRAQYVADPDFVAPPAGRWASLLDADYLARRAATIGPVSMKRAAPGRPAGESRALAPQALQPETGTSHLSIVDAEGGAVAMTTTIEAVFGARLMADGGTGLPGGYLLNNQLTDFSAVPADATGRPIANRVQPGKRPRSSMSPTLVFDARDGRLLMVLGSPLGAAIPQFVARVLTASFVWDLDPAAAIDLPHAVSFNGPTLLETGRFPPALREALTQRGHELGDSDLASGLQVIRRVPTGWVGASDPRREGRALGD